MEFYSLIETFIYEILFLPTLFTIYSLILTIFKNFLLFHVLFHFISYNILLWRTSYMIKKILTYILCATLLLIQITHLHAKGDALPDDKIYRIVNVKEDGSYEIIKTFPNYAEAKVAYTLAQRNHNNLGIAFGPSFLTIDQGVVEFKTGENCGLNISYTLDQNNKSGYTNGCYGADAAFLEYNVATKKVKFKLSGVTGWANASDVTIHPVQKVPSVTSFQVNDNTLYHRIKTSLQYKDFDTSIALSKAPSFLKNDQLYYSYDSHYFYTSFKQMIADYRNGNYKQAVNANEPYINYYQYMSHRSTSNYSEKDITEYFKNTLAIKNTITAFHSNGNYIHNILTQSLLPQATTAFFQYQNMFGANALMMLSLSLNESAIGRSYLAFTRNNVFGHAAFDSAVDKHASRYASVSDSVYSHALDYISNSYLNPTKFQFQGGFFGNKAGGMNVAYASDPYWGEKAAQYYYQIDQALQEKDKDQYAIGISLSNKVDVYTEAKANSPVIYTIEKGYESAFLLLEKIKNADGTWYRVQSDPALDENKKMQTHTQYNFKNNVGYINENTLTTILNSDKVQQKNYVTITFDANGGKFYPDKSSIQLQVEQGKTPSVLAPTKDQALFQNWDIKLGPAQTDLLYKAQYKDVKQLRLTQKPLINYGLEDTLNVKDGKILVEFKDDTTTEVNLTTDMVSGFQQKKEGKQILTIRYAGTSITYEIQVSNTLANAQKTLHEKAAYIIKTYSGKTQLTPDSISELEQFRQDIVTMEKNPFSIDQIRVIDRIFKENLKPRYSVIIKDRTYDTQLSGLHMGPQNKDNFLNRILPKTISVDIQSSIPKEDEEIAKKVAKANRVTYEGAMHISGKDDFSSLKLKQTVAFSIKKPNANDQKLYRVYYIENGEVYQLPTSQSTSRVLFSNNKLGSYAIVSINEQSIKKTFDYTEVNTIKGNGKNYIMIFIIFPITSIIVIFFLGIGYLVYRRKHPNKKKLKKPEPEAQV